MEKWVKVQSYGYEVSDNGRIRRVDPGKGTVAGKIIKPLDSGKPGKHDPKNMYKNVSFSRNGIMKRFLVHRLVAIAFLEAKKGCNEVNHINGDKSDNRASNLEWVTRKENCDHTHNKLKLHIGELCYNSKLTEDSVKKIRGLAAQKITQQKIADALNVSRSLIGMVVNGKRWAHID